jgi:hypothetical protein
VEFVVDKMALGQVFFQSISVTPAIHSTNFSFIIVTRAWHSKPIGGRSAELTQLAFTPHYTNYKNDAIPRVSKSHIIKYKNVRSELSVSGPRFDTDITRM